MLNYSDLKKYDPSNIHKVYDNWAQIAKEAYASNMEPVSFQDINHIVFAGMGGSGSLGDLFNAIFSKTNTHISLAKGYLLPSTVDSHTLVIVVSVSGNTSESINVLKSASKLNCPLIAFSSGGIIESFCKKNDIHFRNIPQIHSPRASYTSYVYSIIKVLQNFLPISDSEIKKSIEELESTVNMISSCNLTESNISLNLAKWITGIPVIYYPAGFQAAAIRFKNSLQENSKIHAMIEDVIEVCHNGIVSWESKSNTQPILIQGKDDYIKTKERWNVIKEYFKQSDIDYFSIHSISGNILSKIICLVLILDYTSIYHAILSKRDPSAIYSIDYIKKRI